MSGWHEEYRRRYAELKKAGKPFFPYTVAKDLLAAALVLGALSWLAWHYGAGLEDLADPTDSTYNPRPEWYFLFMFQALKFFPGRLEPVAAVILPTLGLAALILVPFLDRGPERHPLDRPLWTGLGLLAVAGFSWLTWTGWRSPLTNPVVEKDPAVLSGRRLFGQLRCAYCHQIGGKGGTVGPKLDNAADEESEDWLERHFRDPQAVTPGSKMPKLNLLDDEIKDLIAYLKSLGAGGPYTPEAPKLFAENCAACHRLGKSGGDVGPDLSLIGAARDKAFLRKYVADPAQINPASGMPGFKGQLSDTQLEDLARYLAVQGRAP